MNELFREIREDVRRERLRLLWRHFGKLVVGLSVTVVLATVAAVVWQDRVRGEAQAGTGLLLRGLDRMKVEDYQGAQDLFEALAGKKDSPYYGLAMLRKAEVLALSGDQEGARKTYEELSAHGKGKSRDFADLARLLAGREPGSPAAASAFYHAALERQAWALLEKGEEKEASGIFTQLRDDGQAPFALRQRAALAAEYLAARQGDA
jgi:hypothetical protein